MSKKTKNFIPVTEPVLFVDVGNTLIKTAFWVGKEWQRSGRYRVDELDELIDWINSHPAGFKKIVISSVVEEVTRTLVEKIWKGQCRVLGIDDIPGNLLDYATPHTLGVDRFFACYGAVTSVRRATVVIDSGTACTIDYMSSDGVYRGGVIMPGMSAIERALKAYAPALPEASRSLPAQWPGRTTETCLQWGLTGFFVDGIHASLERYEERFGKFDLVLTGGDAEWLASVIKRDSIIRPLLVFEGMKCFLENHG